MQPLTIHGYKGFKTANIQTTILDFQASIKTIYWINLYFSILLITFKSTQSCRFAKRRIDAAAFIGLNE